MPRYQTHKAQLFMECMKLILCAPHHPSSEIALALEARRGPNHILLNPVIGPEPVTGSTRMKGGSATKIMLVP